MSGNKMVSFVVPVYNGAGMVEALYDRIEPVGMASGGFEVVFVDDGSRDASWSVLQRLQQRSPHVCSVRLSRNFGQHNATLAGLAHARGDVVVTLDQDLQNPPEEVARLIAKLDEGFDVVYGLPEVRAHNAFRNLTSEFSKWVSSKILSTTLNGNFSSFRVLRKWVVDEVVQYDSSYIYLDGFISWTTANVGGVTVRNDATDYGSQYNLIKLVNHGLNLMVNFSIRPLQFASIAGVISAIAGLMAAVWLVINKLFFDIPVQGWTSLMVVLLVIGGVQIAFLGLIGEYVGRILMNSNQAPKYIVRSIQRGSDGSDAGAHACSR
jgi:undecaprenyl-phosphate 4-deoxy-4-formamido-L-arabinose transferase